MGAVVGSAVGDALGAPFEFGPCGVYTTRFPEGVGAMCGGGGWDPGEATDDTQMAVLVGESLLEQDGLDLADMFGRFRRWAAGEPKDIGLQTEYVLTSGDPWDLAAALHFQVDGRAAGNGSLMRAATSAVYFARADGPEVAARAATMDAARRIAALTHGDRAAWEGTAVLHDLIRVALNGDDPLTALPGALAAVHDDQRERWATVLAPGWHPAWRRSSTGRCGRVWAPLSGRCVRHAPSRPRWRPPSTWAGTPTRWRPSPAAWPGRCTGGMRSRRTGRNRCMSRCRGTGAGSCERQS